VTWVPVREDVMDQNLRLGRLLRLEEEAITVLAETEGLLILGTISGTLTLMDQAGNSTLTSACFFHCSQYTMYTYFKERSLSLYAERSPSFYGVKMSSAKNNQHGESNL
jgi:hypothetical protein